MDLLDLLLYLGGGYGGNAATTLLLQVQMLIQLLLVVVLLFPVLLRPVARKGAFQQTWLAGGKFWRYITFGPSWWLLCCWTVRHGPRPPELRQTNRS